MSFVEIFKCGIRAFTYKCGRRRVLRHLPTRRDRDLKGDHSFSTAPPHNRNHPRRGLACHEKRQSDVKHNYKNLSQETSSAQEEDPIFDTKIFSSAEEGIFRRLLVDPKIDRNIISQDIPDQLKMPITPYSGPNIRLPDTRSVTPVGIVNADWQFYGEKICYTCSFLVIPDDYFDMLLGRESIIKYGLHESHPQIAKRLNKILRDAPIVSTDETNSWSGG